MRRIGAFHRGHEGFDQVNPEISLERFGKE